MVSFDFFLCAVAALIGSKSFVLILLGQIMESGLEFGFRSDQNNFFFWNFCV